MKLISHIPALSRNGFGPHWWAVSLREVGMRGQFPAGLVTDPLQSHFYVVRMRKLLVRLSKGEQSLSSEN